jgi:hypothetical protein
MGRAAVAVPTVELGGYLARDLSVGWGFFFGRMHRWGWAGGLRFARVGVGYLVQHGNSTCRIPT